MTEASAPRAGGSFVSRHRRPLTAPRSHPYAPVGDRPAAHPPQRLIALGGAVLAVWVAKAMPALWTAVRGHQPGDLHPVAPVDYGHSALFQLAVIAAVAVAYGCALLAEPPSTLGLRHAPWQRQVTTLGAYILLALLLGAVAQAAFSVVADHWHWLAAHQGVNFTDLPTTPWWYRLTHAAYGGSEELVALALVYRGLEYVRLGGRVVAATWMGTALLVILRISYHAYYGVYALAFIPWAYLTVVIYRRTRLLAPIVLGHVGYDLLVGPSAEWFGGYGLPVVLAATGLACMAPSVRGYDFQVRERLASARHSLTTP